MNSSRSYYICRPRLLAILFLILFQVNDRLVFSQQLHSKYEFGKITVEDRLSSNVVYAILQDKSGLLWFGTENGLSRFDGYDFKVFRKDSGDINSIYGNDVWSVFEDHSGLIWIGTKSGELNCYDPSNETFKHIALPPGNIKENSITCIYEDKKNNNLWIGTYKYGLFKYTPGTRKFEHWHRNNDNPGSLSNNYVTSICEDKTGNIWIATYNGLNKFNPGSKDKPFTRFFRIQGNKNSLSNNLIWNIAPSSAEPGLIWICTLNGLTKFYPAEGTFSRLNLPVDRKLKLSNSISSVTEDSAGGEKILWIGTYGGLLRINLNSGKSERFTRDINNTSGIVSNQVNFLYKDRSGVVWIGTNNGLNYFSHKTAKFNYLYQSSQNIPGINELFRSNIEAMTYTENGNIWIGTNAGLYYLTNNKRKQAVYKFKRLGHSHIWSLETDKSRNLWIGTYGEGLKRLDLKRNELINMKLTNPARKSSSYNYIRSMVFDREGRLWIGFWGAGLAVLNTSSGEIKFFRNETNKPGSLSYNDVSTIYEDSKGRIWIGTWGGGLNLYNEHNGNFIIREKTGIREDGLINNNINCVFESSNYKDSDTSETVLWIGTRNGLEKLIIKNGSDLFDISAGNIVISQYTVNEGLPDNSIESIAEDKNGNLWLGTGSGISHFDLRKNAFINYSVSDRLNGNIFNPGSALYTGPGLMLFGSTSGLTIFDPENIKRSSYSPPVLITEFSIFNQPVPVGGDSPLKTSIIKAKEIEPSFEQNVLSFKFSSLDYNSPNSNRYAYKMEGFDKEWIYSGSRRFVTYTNLFPGTYTFRVMGTNSDGIWSGNNASLKIIIMAPWWRTDWAYALYISLIVAGLFAIRRFEKNRMQLRKELRMVEFEARKHKEIENIKSRFFENLSHEFRTPLMLIKGPLEQLAKKNSNTEAEKQYKIIYRNTEKLQGLIDQLLELTQLEADAIPLKAKKENLINIIRGIISAFDSLAVLKNINLSFYSGEEKLNAWTDRDKLEKIMNNLLSNALKFTPDGGQISVKAEKIIYMKQDYAEIKVSDTGIGIPADKIAKIFDRFYQVDDSPRKAYGGSGIGLSVVKELTELHKWNISVKSNENSGTEFTLRIPLFDSYLNDNEKIGENIAETDSPKLPAHRYPDHDVVRADSTTATPDKNGTDKNEKPDLLIVEDSEDVRSYLSGIFNGEYNIHLSKNSDEGLSTAGENSIDLIISDVMMPGTDGMEFCRRIKSNWETSHIPVILLTAKASTESKLEGLETGADDYLTKPFDSEELIVRVKNLLRQRKMLRERFGLEINGNLGTITTSRLDNDFLKKALEIAEKNLDNDSFDSESFAGEMFISRSQFHRKLIAVTGQAPGEFLRTVRLKKAARLILERKLSITQIAFAVGFNSPSHFSKVFRRQFNCLPSEFAKKANS